MGSTGPSRLVRRMTNGRARWRGSRSTGAPGTGIPRCGPSTPSGTAGSPPSCRPAALGPRLELGSGPGFAREFIPDLELSDVVRAPWHDREASAEALPFDDGSARRAGPVRRAPSPADAATLLRRGDARAAPRRSDRDVRAVREPASYPVYKLLHEPAGPGPTRSARPRTPPRRAIRSTRTRRSPPCCSAARPRRSPTRSRAGRPPRRALSPA